LLYARSIHVVPRVPVIIFLLGDCDYLTIREVEVVIMRRGVFEHGLDFERGIRHAGRL
jgi:hypothetical protein